MEEDKVKMVFKIDDEELVLYVNKSDEPYFSDARSLFKQRLYELSRTYATHTQSKKLPGIVAVEALVDALKINNNYQKLKAEVEKRIENLDRKIEY